MTSTDLSAAYARCMEQWPKCGHKDGECSASPIRQEQILEATVRRAIMSLEAYTTRDRTIYNVTAHTLFDDDLDAKTASTNRMQALIRTMFPRYPMDVVDELAAKLVAYRTTILDEHKKPVAASDRADKFEPSFTVPEITTRTMGPVEFRERMGWRGSPMLQCGDVVERAERMSADFPSGEYALVVGVAFKANNTSAPVSGWSYTLAAPGHAGDPVACTEPEERLRLIWRA